MFSPEQSIRPGAEDKLAALRRLDKSRAWNSLDDQLYCTICKSVISGRQIEVVGGTNGLRALHLKCSTPGCFSTPADWILPVKSDTVREINILFRDNGASTVRLLGKIDLADYLHSDRSSIVGGSNFLKFFHDTSTLKLSQRLEHSHVESVSILGRRIGLPKPSADPDF